MSDTEKQVIWVTSKMPEQKITKDIVKEEEEYIDEESIEEIDEDTEEESKERQDEPMNHEEEGGGGGGQYVLTQARFQCSMCHFVASCHQAYTDHMNIHTGIKPYCCQYCPFSSAFRSSLLRHVKIHTNANEKPFRCARCSYESRYKWNVTVHMRKCHKDFSDCKVSLHTTNSMSQPLPKISSVFSVNPPISQSSETSSEMSSSPESMYASVNMSCTTEERDDIRHRQVAPGLQSPPTNEQVFHFSNAMTSPKQNDVNVEHHFQQPNDSHFPKTAAALKLFPSTTKSIGVPQIRSVPYTITAPLSHTMMPTQIPLSMATMANNPLLTTVSTTARDNRLYQEHRRPLESPSPKNNRDHPENIPTQNNTNMPPPSNSPEIQSSDSVKSGPEPSKTFRTESTQTSEEPSVSCTRCAQLPNNLKSCHHCGTLFTDNVIYTLHMSCHGKRHPFQCGICGYECRDKIEFTCHITRSQHKN
ncbi:uncharacterized protein LOC144446397 [Glandiceps talaboti]